jgi:SAM-dependent methyltransferase
MSETDYGPTTYGDRIAELYDAMYVTPFPDEPPEIARFLASVKGQGRALELGIGTGRIALPLQELGVEVEGVDASGAMVARLREKPGGDRIPVTITDFANFELDRPFGLIYVVFNTFFALLTPEDQRACFETIARHLAEDGVFVMEAFVPDHGRFDRGQRVSAIRVDVDEVQLEVSMHDPITQVTRGQHIVIREDGIRLFPVAIRFASVPELDLMARLAGLRLRDRWADWDRTPFGPGAGKHISVWGCDPAAG